MVRKVSCPKLLMRGVLDLNEAGGALKMKSNSLNSVWQISKSRHTYYQYQNGFVYHVNDDAPEVDTFSRECYQALSSPRFWGESLGLRLGSLVLKPSLAFSLGLRILILFPKSAYYSITLFPFLLPISLSNFNQYFPIIQVATALLVAGSTLTFWIPPFVFILKRRSKR